MVGPLPGTICRRLLSNLSDLYWRVLLNSVSMIVLYTSALSFGSARIKTDAYPTGITYTPEVRKPINVH